MKGSSDLDPKGLIYQAYRIDGITSAQCRSIFLDWALSLPSKYDTQQALQSLCDQYCDPAPDHPMTQVITQGMTTITAPRRRGGWRSRPRN